MFCLLLGENNMYSLSQISEIIITVTDAVVF